MEKKLTKAQKDLPRYRAILTYEAEFKASYTRMLGNGIEELLKSAKKIKNKKIT